MDNYVINLVAVGSICVFALLLFLYRKTLRSIVFNWNAKTKDASLKVAMNEEKRSSVQKTQVENSSDVGLSTSGEGRSISDTSVTDSQRVNIRSE